MSWLTDTLKGAASNLVGGLPGALLGAGTSLIGSLVSNSQGRSNQNRQNAWQEAMADKQNEWSEKMNLQQQEWQEGMWNKTNAYNNASAQMNRMMDAGINPNNAAGLVNGNGSMATLAQQPQIPNANPFPSGGQFAAPNMDLAGATFAGMSAQKEMELKDAQRENIEADTAQKLSTSDVNASQKKLLETQVESFKIDNYYKPQQYDAVIREMDAHASQLIASSELSKSEKAQVDYTVKELLPLTKNLTLAQIGQAGAAIKEMLAAAALSAEQVKTEKERQDLLDSQTEGQDIANRQQRGVGMLERLTNINMSREQIRNLKLSNDEKSYIVDQLKAFGVVVSDKDIDPLVKSFLLSRLGYGDDGFGTAAYGVTQKVSDIKSGLREIFGQAGQIVTTIVAARVAGGAVGRGMNSITPSKGAHTYQHQGNVPYQNTSTTIWNPYTP